MLKGKTKRILAALLLTIPLLTAAQCDASKADRIAFAFDAAQHIPAVLGVTGWQAEFVSDSFAVVAVAAHNFRDGKITWAAFVATFDEVRARPSWQRLNPALRERVEAVWAVAGRIVASLKPPPGARVAQPSAKDLKRVSEDDLQALERAVGRRK